MRLLSHTRVVRAGVMESGRIADVGYDYEPFRTGRFELGPLVAVKSMDVSILVDGGRMLDSADCGIEMYCKKESKNTPSDGLFEPLCWMRRGFRDAICYIYSVLTYHHILNYSV